MCLTIQHCLPYKDIPLNMYLMRTYCIALLNMYPEEEGHALKYKDQLKVLKQEIIVLQHRNLYIGIGRSEGGKGGSLCPPWTCRTILVENKLGIIHIVLRPMGGYKLYSVKRLRLITNCDWICENRT